MSYISRSENQTKKIAKKIQQSHPQTQVFALTGKLGAGKTVFAQGFAKSLGIREKIISPTFVIIRQHHIPGSQKTFYHIDLYRIEDIDNIKMLGVEELLKNPNNIVLIEWAQKAQKMLPKDTVYIKLKQIGEQAREIEVNE